MSFVEQKDILDLMEELFTGLIESITPHYSLIKPFPRLKYADIMDKYGTDKPDLRFGLEIHDLSEIASKTQFNVFKTALAQGGKVKGICAPGCAGYNRRQ